VEIARGEALADRPLAGTAEIAAQQIDRAVLSSVAHADRLRATLGTPQPSAELYRHVLDLFPQSRWAAVARQRIESPSAMN
jgi:hypothetical protein